MSLATHAKVLLERLDRLIWELLDEKNVSPRALGIMQVRSIVTLCVFGIASVVALKFPLAALGMCICCLILYLRPAAPGS